MSRRPKRADAIKRKGYAGEQEENMNKQEKVIESERKKEEWHHL